MVLTVPVAPARHLSVVRTLECSGWLRGPLALDGLTQLPWMPWRESYLWNKVSSLRLAPWSMGTLSELHKTDTTAFYFTPIKTEKK